MQDKGHRFDRTTACLPIQPKKKKKKGKFVSKRDLGVLLGESTNIYSDFWQVCFHSLCYLGHFFQTSSLCR